MRTERGSVILEAILLLLVLTIFFKGARTVQRRFGERYQVILRHRNDEIAKLRKEAAAKLLLPGFLPVHGDGGMGGAKRKRGGT